MVLQRSHVDHRLARIAPRTAGILFWWKVGFLPAKTMLEAVALV
jgi:hypothetical protein